MKKYLAYYENEWPANIAELTAIENKPFVGYLKDVGMQYTVVPKPVTGPADNEIWYTTANGEKAEFGSPFLPIMLYGGKDEYPFQAGIPGNEGLESWGTSIGDIYNVISHEYNAKVGYFVIKFDKPILEYNLQTSDRRAWDGGGWTSSNQPNKIILANSIQIISWNVFLNCTSLTTITIPNSVTSIGYEAFQGCSSLSCINFNGTKDQWNTIEKGYDWNYGIPATYVQCTDGQVEI